MAYCQTSTTLELAINSPSISRNMKSKMVPCLSCKKRRVWCDGTNPCCIRCYKDGIECPGYVRIREWTSTANRTQGAAGHTVKRSKIQENVHGVENNELVCASNARSGEWPELFDTDIISIPLNQDRETLLMFDAFRQFNTELVPGAMPKGRPFRRQDVEMTDNFLTGSRFFQYMLVLATRGSKAALNHRDPLADPEFCYYRALCVPELKSLVEDSLSEPHGIALTAIIMFLLSDLWVPSDGMWEYHLEAARKLISLRGGFRKCIPNFSFTPLLFINYMAVDIFSATASDPLSLTSARMATHWEYLDLLENEEDLIALGFILPPVIREVIHTTFLRGSRRSKSLHAQPPPKDFATILQSIERFSPVAWANRVALYGGIHPQTSTECASLDCIAAWATIATCYKSAALLYLLMSCSDSRRDHTEAKVLSVKHTLSTHIRTLYDIGSSDPDGPLETQLWKHLNWPILISTYVRVGWNIGVESIDVEVKRLRSISAASTRRAMFGSSTLLYNLMAADSHNVEITRPWNDTMDAEIFSETAENQLIPQDVALEW